RPGQSVQSLLSRHGRSVLQLLNDLTGHRNHGWDDQRLTVPLIGHVTGYATTQGLSHAVRVILPFASQVHHHVVGDLAELLEQVLGIPREALGLDVRSLQRTAGAVVDDNRHGDEAALGHRGAVLESICVHVAHAGAVDVQVAHGDLSHDLRVAVMQVHDDAVLGPWDVRRGHPGRDGHVAVSAQMAPLAVHWHRVTRTRGVVKEQQLSCQTVTRGVDVGVAAGDHRGTDLREHVDHAEHCLLVTRNQGGRKNDQVAVADGDLAVLPACHARQCSHRLTLGAGGNENHLVRSHAGGLVHGDDGASRGVQVTHALCDLHVPDHRAAGEGHLAVRRHRRVHGGLDASHVGGEGCQDHALLRIAGQAGQRRGHVCFRTGESRGCGVGGGAEHEIHALIAEARQRRQVRRTAVDRGLVELNVASVDHQTGRGLQRDAKAIRNGVVDVPETQVKRTVIHVRLVVDLDDLRALTVLLGLGLDECRGEAGGNDRDVRALLQQPRDRTDVVLVTVGDHKSLDAVPLIVQVGEVRQDQVHARLTAGWEEHATVDKQQAAVVFEDSHVAADLGDTTASDDAQPALGQSRRLGQALGQIRPLHGLQRPATTVPAAATAVVVPVAAAGLGLISTATGVVLAAAVIPALLIAVVSALGTTTAAGATITGTTPAVTAIVIAIAVADRALATRVGAVAGVGGLGRLLAAVIENGRSLSVAHACLIGTLALLLSARVPRIGLCSSFRGRRSRLSGYLASPRTIFSHIILLNPCILQVLFQLIKFGWVYFHNW